MSRLLFCAANSGSFRCILAAIPLLIQVSLPNQSAAQSCPSIGATVGTEDAEFADGIACGADDSPITVDYTFTLEDGLNIDNDDGKGLVFYGERDISILTQGPEHDVLIVGGDGDNALEVQGNAMAMPNKADPQSVRIEAGEIRSTKDGIRVTEVFGDLEIQAHGTITVSNSENPGFGGSGIYAYNAGPNVVSMSTDITVSDIISTAVEGSNPDPLIAGIYVDRSGQVSIRSTGMISTSGSDVHGVYAFLGTDAAMKTRELDISVNDILTTGDESYGIYAGIFEDEVEEGTLPITVTVEGKVETRGSGSHGLFLQSGGGAVQLNIAEQGSIVAWPSEGESQQNCNDLTATKAILISDCFDTTPAPFESVQITNHGTVSGDVCATASNAPRFENYGTLNAGLLIKLFEYTGTGSCNSIESHSEFSLGELVSSGTLSPGSLGRIGITQLAANYIQQRNGVLELDVDWSKKTSDQVRVSGSANLEGTVTVNLLSDPMQLPVSLDQSSTANLLTILTAQNIELGDAGLDAPGTLLVNHFLTTDITNTSLRLGTFLNLNPDGLNQNQLNVLEEVHASRDESSTIGSVFSEFLNETELADLQNELDGLGNEIAGASIQSGIWSVQSFGSSIPRCDFRQQPIDRMKPCYQLSWDWSELARERTHQERGYLADQFQLLNSFGWAFDNAPVSLEAAVGVNRHHIKIEEFASSKGRSISAGLQWSGSAGAVEYSLTFSGNRSSFETTRHIAFDQSNSVGEFSLTTYSARGMIRYPIEIGSLRLIPSVSIDSIRYDSRPYTETGSDDLSLQVGCSKGSATIASADLQLETQPFEVFGLMAGPTMGLSWKQASNPGLTVRSQLTGGLNSFESTSSLVPSEIESKFGLRIWSKSENFAGTIAVSASQGKGGLSKGKGAEAQFTIYF